MDIKVGNLSEDSWLDLIDLQIDPASILLESNVSSSRPQIYPVIFLLVSLLSVCVRMFAERTLCLQQQLDSVGRTGSHASFT